MKKSIIVSAIAAAAIASPAVSTAEATNFNYKVDRFADIEVLRYQVPERYVCMLYDSKRIMSTAAQKLKKILLEELSAI